MTGVMFQGEVIQTHSADDGLLTPFPMCGIKTLPDIFSLEIPARSFLSLFHATACYGAPKGSQNWTKNERFVSFFFVLFVAVFSEISKISFKT